MPNTIDERIVEMQFDNKNFEKNIKQSLKSLEQLDQALEMKDAAKGFEELERAANSVDLSKLERAADVIEKRFSTAGIAGAALINKAVNELVDGVVGLGKKVVGLAKSGGISRALKLEHAQFMLEGLLKDANAAAAIVSGPVNNAVKGTAYGLDAAANAAAQLAASGVTDMQEMEKVLKGIAGVASMTGSEFEDISQIFTTVAGQGKVMTRQLRQIEARGLNAAATIAKSLDTTESAVREMVKDGEISFKIFSDAMADAFGEQAKKANETFEGALKNVKAALSRIGAKVATPSLEAMRWLLVECIDFVDKLNVKLSSGIIPEINTIIDRISVFAYELLHDAKTMEFVEGVLTNILKIFHLFSNLLDPLSMAMKEVFPGSLIDNLIAFNDGFGKLLDKLKLTEQQSTYLAHIFRGILDILDLALMAIEGIFNISIPGLGKLFDVTDSLSTKLLKIGAFIGVLIDRFHDFVKSGGFASTVLSKIGDLFSFIGSNLPSVLDLLKVAITIIGGLIYIIGNSVYEIGLAIKNVAVYLSKLKPVQDALATVKDIISWIGDKLLYVLGLLGSSIAFIATQVHRLASGDVASVFEDIKNAVSPLGGVFDAVTSAIKGFFGLFSSNEVKKVQDGIEKVTVKFDKNMGGVPAHLAAKTGSVTKNSPVAAVVNSTAQSVSVLEYLTDKVKSVWGGLVGVFTTSTENVSTAANNAGKSFNNFYENTKSVFSGLANLGTLFSLAFGAAVIATIVSIARVLGTASRMFSGLGRLSMSINNFFNALTVGVNSFAIMQAAIAISAIAGALYLLTKNVDSKKLLVAAGAITAIFAALVGSVAVMKFVDPKAVGRFQTVASGFIAFAGSILILAISLKKIYDVAGDSSRLIKSVGALVVLLAALTGVGIALGTFGMRRMVLWKGGLALIEMAAALYAMASSLAKLAEIDLDKAYQALPLVTAILGEFALIMFASSVSFSPVAGLGALGLVSSILLLMKGLESLKKVDPDVLEQALKIIDLLCAWIYKMIWAIAAIKLLETIESAFNWATMKIQGITSGIKGMFAGINRGFKNLGNAMALAALVVGVTGAIWIIVDAMEKISKFTTDELKRAGIVVGIITGVIIGIFVLLAKMGIELGKRRKASESIRDTLLSTSAMLIAMAASLKIISGIPRDDLVRAGNAVGAMVLIIGGLVGLLSLVRTIGPMASVGIATMGALSLFLFSMTACLGILSLVFKDATLVQVGKAIAAIIGVTAGMAIVILALGKLAPFTVPATVAVGLISVLFLSLAGSFYILGQTNLENAKENLIMLGICVGLLAGVVMALSILTGTTGGLGAGTIAIAEALVEGLVGILGSLAGVGHLLASINPEGLKATFQTLADGINIFTDAIKLLGERLLSEEWKAIMAGGYGLLGFAYILQAFVPVAVGFATAAILFGGAVYAFGEGVKALGAGLQTMQNIDTTTVSANLKSIAESCSSLGYYGPGLIIAGAGFMSLGFGLAAFDIGAAGAVAVLKALSAKDIFSNIEQNFQILANAFKIVTDNILYFGTTFALLAGFIAMTFVLSGAILALSLAIGVFGGALYILFGGLNAVMGLVDQFGQWISSLASDLEKAATALDNLGRNTVQDIYAALIQNADMLKDAGAVLVQKVADGFKEGITEAFDPAITDAADYVVKGFTNAIDAQKQTNYQCGVNFAKGFLDGLMGNAGLDENSPSKKTEKAGKYAGEGFKNGVTGQSLLSALSSAGANWAVELLNGLSDKLSALFPGIMDQVSQMVNSITAAFDSVGAEVESKYGIKNTWYGSKRLYNQLKNGTVEYHGPGGDYGVSSGRRVESTIQSRANNTASIYNSIKAINAESEALGGNSKAAGKNSKAKAENEEANDGKTSAIDEETESLGEETEATNENEEAIRAMAEQIEVVTEKYKELNAWFGWSNKFKIVGKEFSALGQAWSKSFKDVQRSSNGTETILKHTYKEVASYFNEAKKTIPKTANKVAKGLYAFDSETDKLGKRLTKRLSNGSKSLKKITSTVQSTGKTIARVYEGYAKVYTKLGGGKTEKLTIRLTKNVKNLAKQAKAASDFVKNLNPNPNSNAIQYVEDLTDNLRKIENFFVKRQNMPKKVQDYLGGILSNFNKDFKYSMNILAKQIDGIGDYWKKGTQSTAYVADAFTQLAATLYDGSEAANQYWTEIERMRFLVEQGVEPAEKLEELYKSYLSRAVEALKEYKKQLDETIAGQFNPFEEFDEKVEDQTKDLLGCLESQIRGFERWGEGLNALAARGADFNLMKELADQGVESYGIMKNLLSMTAGELALYNKYYRMIDTVKQKASDAALAAVANARTQASLRAAAKSGKLSEKQMEKQRNIAKRMTDDIKSVAHAEVYYNSMTKKQEKEYLKTLNKKEKAKYKAEKKAAKKAKKEQERLAAEEEAKRAEENRVQTIMDTIKGYESLLKVMDEYCNDTNVMTKLNEKLDDSLSGVYKNLGKSVDVSRAWVKFADQLGAEGDDSESYFNSLKSTIESFRDGIKNALYDITRAFEEFKQDTDKKLNLNKMFSNTISQARASRLFGQYIEKMANMGYNSQIIEYIGKKFSSDQAGALAEMAQMVNATRQEITNLNASFKAYSDAMEKSMKQADQAVIRSQRDPQKEAFEAAQKRYKTAQDNLKKLTEETTGFDRLYAKTLKNSYTEEVAQAMRDNMTMHGNSWDKTYNKQYQAYKKAVEQVLNTNSASIKTKLDTIKKLQERYGIKSENVYSGRAKEIYEQMQVATKRGDKELAKILKRRLEAMTGDRFGDSIEARIAALQAEYEAALKAAKAEAANASAAYQRAQKIWQEEQALRARLEAERKAQEAYENALIDVAGLIEKFDELTAAIGKARWSTDYIRRTYVKLNAAIAPVANAVAFAKERFADFEGTSKSALKDLSALEEGFFRLASTLDASNDEAGNLIDNLGARLEAYRKTLYDTIKGQVQLFDEFKKYSGDEATSADTYLDNMASQINGLSEWLTNLETLAKRGVSGDILQLFAAEGQGSFEKVAAFANATDAQLGELISQYRKYIDLTDEAADRALAAIGASYSDKAQDAANALVDVFKSTGMERVKDAAYEAGAMVITGVKDGIGHEMPSIISAVEKTAEEVTSKLATGISASQVTSAVVAGLNDVDKAIAATMSVTLSGFYDSITEQAVTKFKMAVDEINQYVTEQLATDYTITIHVDTSEIDAAVARMNEAIAMTNASAGQTSQAYATSQANQHSTSTDTSNTTPATNVTNVTLNQTNNSPKSLSQVEIYRDTQNALNQIKNTLDIANMGG